MAGLLLLCMTTFVLCTGLGGDLGDFILKTFSSRSKGAVLAKIDGVSYYSTDFNELKTGRQAANAYMRKFCEKLIVLADKRTEKLDKGLDDKTRQEKAGLNSGIKTLLEKRIANGRRFFDGGVKLDDLVDYKIWLLEADKLKIPPLTDRKYIFELFEAEFHRALTNYNLDTVIEVMQDTRLNANISTPSAEFVWQAIANEYRVQMAKLALITYQPSDFLRSRETPEPSVFWLRHQVARHPFEDSDDPIRDGPLPFENMRVPVAPAQLWSYFLEKRREFNIDIVPVLAEIYTQNQDPSAIAAGAIGLLGTDLGPLMASSSIRAQVAKNRSLDSMPYIPAPSEEALKLFYDSYKKKPYDPLAEEPGFAELPKVGVTWLSADPESAHYKAFAKKMAAKKFEEMTPEQFETVVGVLSIPDSQAGLTTVAEIVPFLVGPLATRQAERKYLQENYYDLGKDDRGDMPYADVPITSANYEANLLAFLARNNSALSQASALGALVGRLDGPLAAPAALLAMSREEALDPIAVKDKKQGFDLYKDEYRKMLRTNADKRAKLLATWMEPAPENASAKDQIEKRALFYSGLVGLGTDDPRAVGLHLANVWAKLAKKPEFLAFKEVMPSFEMPKFLEKYEKKLAGDEALRNMEELRKYLVDEIGKKIEGNGASINRALSDEQAAKLSFDRHATKKLYDRYDIKDAPELKPLRDLYEKHYVQINQIEGRLGTDKAVLKDTDFDKLFFDKSESFSTGGGLFNVRAFPPSVTNKSGNWTLRGQSLEQLTPDQVKASNKQVPIPLFSTAANPVIFWIDRKEDPNLDPRLYTAAELAAAETELNQKKGKLEAEFKEKEAATAKAVEALKKEFSLDQMQKEHDEQKLKIEKDFAGKPELAKNLEDLKNKYNLEQKHKELHRKKLELENDLKSKQAELDKALAVLTNEYKLEAKKDLRARVEKAWKITKAREEYALPTARRIAELLLDRSNQPTPTAFREAKALGLNYISMHNIAPLIAERSPGAPGQISYSPIYSKMTKDDTLRYPMDQMAKQLQTFGDPKEPLKTGYKQLDEINDELFKKFKETKLRRYVQIFTNKPRDRFFVAVMSTDPIEDKEEFYQAYKAAPATKNAPRNQFIAEAYNGIGKQAYEAMMQQLHDPSRFWITQEKDDRKSFDTSD